MLYKKKYLKSTKLRILKMNTHHLIFIFPMRLSDSIFTPFTLIWGHVGSARALTAFCLVSRRGSLGGWPTLVNGGFYYWIITFGTDAHSGICIPTREPIVSIHN